MPRIVAVDSATPPRSVSIQLDQPAYAAVLLVAPGHSATLLYPGDSLTENRLAAGASVVNFEIPEILVRNDSVTLWQRTRERQIQDSLLRRRGRGRDPGRPGLTPLPPATAAYLMIVSSPQPLNYSRIIDKTAGVSIPLMESEALNAVGKAIKSTLLTEPREWSGTYQRIKLFRER